MKITIQDVAFDDDDPRFTELVAYLRAIRQRGRNSPTPRMVAEWALLGFLLTTGKIAIGGSGASGSVALPALPEGIPDPAEVAEAKRLAAEALDDLFA